MYIDTSEICDLYPDNVDVMDPIFMHFGGIQAFHGKITTVKCYETNGLIAEMLEEDGNGRVLVIDGGGIMRSALIDADLAQLAADNQWEGIIVNGAVRQIQELAQIDIAIIALGAFPVGAVDEMAGEADVPVNFAGVSIYPDDYVYSDTTGTIFSETILDLSRDFDSLSDNEND